METLTLGKVEQEEWQEDKPVPILVTNELVMLPEELAGLEKLQSLNLSGNPLAIIFELVFQLQTLKSGSSQLLVILKSFFKRFFTLQVLPVE
jgi:Leucine-rich repeat (LRR) protein